VPVGIAVGEPGAERDQVVLGGQLGILQLLLPAPADGPPDHEAKQADHHKDAKDDQEVPQRVRGSTARGLAGPGPGLLLHLGHEVG